MNLILILLLICTSFAFIPTTSERVRNAIQQGFSHEPWRADYIVLHWDFTFPQEDIEAVQKEMHRTVRMDWNRNVHARMRHLYYYYRIYQEAQHECKQRLRDCQAQCKRAGSVYPTDVHAITTGSLLYDCFNTTCQHQCSEQVMSDEVREYIKLKSMNSPNYDRMLIGNYIE